MQEQLPIKWSAIDEAHLQALLQLKAEFEKTARGSVKAIVDTLLCHAGATQTTDINESFAEALITHADQVRDALEPFDSGVRQA